MFRYLPEQASELAPRVDWIHNIITDLSVLFTVLIVGAMLYFAVRYRAKKGESRDNTPRILGSHFLEIIWTVVPTIISIFIAYEGVVVYNALRKVPEGALVINVEASRWKWDFTYDTGKKTTGEFVVPVGKPIKMILTSQPNEVLHSFFLPAMRVKSDVIPGQYTYVTFTPVKTGEYHTFCTEYCGTNHSGMYAKLKVVPEVEYARWVNDKSEKAVPLSEKGKLLYNQQGCKTCHTLDGSRGIGPTFLKLYGSKHQAVDGSEFTVDEAYIQKSIYEPNAYIVPGYPPAMPQNFKSLSVDDIAALIGFIKAQDGSATVVKAAAAPAPAAANANLSPAERGKLLYTAKICNSCHSIDGSKLVGPSFKALYGREGGLADGSKYVANDAYIKESIQNPAAKVVEGYPPAMPAGLVTDEKEMDDLIAYIKTLK